MKEKKRNRFYDWFTYNYQMIIRNEENFAEKTTITFNYAKVSLLLAFIFTSVFGLGLLFDRLVIGTKSEAEDAQIEEEVINLSQQIDSLESALDQRHNLILSLKTMINGGEPAYDSLAYSGYSSFEDDDEALTQYEAEQESNSGTMRVLPASNSSQGKINMSSKTLFFPPLQGYAISESYNPKQELYGVRIKAKEDEPVTAIADGTVIMAAWTSEEGYVIALQHEDNIISIYKHSAMLLKKVGNYVKAGDLVAIVGKGGDHIEVPYLQFELWQEGYSLNPEYFISF